MKLATGVALLFIAGISGACFVNDGDCESHGVSIDPCAVPAKIGQTRQLKAQVTNDPAQDVTWVMSQAALDAFDVSFQGNTMQLISKLGIAGTYLFRAESPTDSSQFGDAVVTVGLPALGYPPPPIQIFGADFPDDYQAAIAAGGDRYYVAYTDVVNVAARAGSQVVGFVQQFDARSNQPLARVSDAFSEFSSEVFPTIAADAQGNAYWVESGPLIRRLRRDGVELEGQELFGLTSIQSLAVAPDGTLYFFAEFDGIAGKSDLGCVRFLFRLQSLGALPETLSIEGIGSCDGGYESVIVDAEGRLLLADQGPKGNPAILRLLPDPGSTTLAVDPTFVLESADNFGFSALCTDAFGVVYAVAPGSFDSPCDLEDEFLDGVLLFDSVGRFVRERVDGKDLPVQILCYEYVCPDGCADALCGQAIPFDSIRSIAATPDGRLRIVDDVTLQLPEGDPCQVTVRIVLIDL